MENFSVKKKDIVLTFFNQKDLAKTLQKFENKFTSF
jgi:hypothetical protein